MLSGGEDSRILFWDMRYPDKKYFRVINMNDIQGQLGVLAGNSVVNLTEIGKAGIVISTKSGEVFKFFLSTKTGESFLKLGQTANIKESQNQKNDEISNSDEESDLDMSMDTDKTLSKVVMEEMVYNQQSENSFSEIIFNGHSGRFCLDIALCMIKPEIYTLSDSNIVYQWNYIKQNLKVTTKINHPVSRISLAPNNDYLAVACANGIIQILEPIKLRLVYEVTFIKNEPSYLKFSPSSDLLAVGCVNGDVIILSSSMKFQILANLYDLSDFRVNSIDFSLDNCFIKVIFDSYDEEIIEISSGDKLNPKNLKDRDTLATTEWCDFSSLKGWELSGISSYYKSFREVIGLTLSEIKDIVISYDEYGKVKIFNFPACENIVPHESMGFFTGPVSKVAITEDNSRLFILSKEAKALYQVELHKSSGVDDQKIREYQKSIVDQIDNKTSNVITKLGMNIEGTVFGSLSKSIVNVKEEENPYFYKNALKHLWPKETLRENSTLKNVQELTCKIPNMDTTFELYSSFNINIKNSKSPLRYLTKKTSSSQLLYFCGAIGVIYDTLEQRKSFFLLHKHTVQAFDICEENHNMIVSAESQLLSETQRASIYIWNLKNRRIRGKLLTGKGESVKLLKLSPNASRIAVVGHSFRGYRVLLYDILSMQLLNFAYLGTNKIEGIAFKDDTNFVTIGQNHIRFWQISGRMLTQESGIWGEDNKVMELTAITFAFNSNICFTGSKDGKILSWAYDSKRIMRMQKLHNSEMVLLQGYESHLYSGCKEGKVYVWNYAGKLQLWARLFDFEALEGNNAESRYAVNLCFGAADKYVIATGEGGEVYVKDENGKDFDILDEISTTVYGISLALSNFYLDFCLDENGNKLITVSKDYYIKKWQLSDARMLKKRKFNFILFTVEIFEKESVTRFITSNKK